MKCRWNREGYTHLGILALSPVKCPGTIACDRLGAARNNRHLAEKRESLEELYHKNEHAQLFLLNISVCSLMNL